MSGQICPGQSEQLEPATGLISAATIYHPEGATKFLSRWIISKATFSSNGRKGCVSVTERSL